MIALCSAEMVSIPRLRFRCDDPVLEISPCVKVQFLSNPGDPVHYTVGGSRDTAAAAVAASVWTSSRGEIRGEMTLPKLGVVNLEASWPLHFASSISVEVDENSVGQASSIDPQWRQSEVTRLTQIREETARRQAKERQEKERQQKEREEQFIQLMSAEGDCRLACDELRKKKFRIEMLIIEAEREISRGRAHVNRRRPTGTTATSRRGGAQQLLNRMADLSDTNETILNVESDKAKLESQLNLVECEIRQAQRRLDDVQERQRTFRSVLLESPISFPQVTHGSTSQQPSR
ncbi:hypothetical protein Pelo_12330 [Pelomyxa schiedti]|nr:hypothetical protein Pelo_12330 [Pelomyxa schiedti]